MTNIIQKLKGMKFNQKKIDQALLELDGTENKEIRRAGDNPVVKNLYKEDLTPKKEHKLFHTNYPDKS